MSTPDALLSRVRELIKESLPLPAGGATALRHTRLMAVGREDLSLARLMEAHWDALAILSEAGLEPVAGAFYAVWAAEKPGAALQIHPRSDGSITVFGEKMWLSGAGLVDHALVTAGPSQLVELDLRAHAQHVRFDYTGWKTEAFRDTRTAAGSFDAMPITRLVGDAGWYTRRIGFWHGACGPAACWAGGAAGLVDFALSQTRDDAHTLAHLGAMAADVWALTAYLDCAGQEIDSGGHAGAQVRALTLRHLVEQACTDVLRRLPRALGPLPLATDQAFLRRCQELELYLRQNHAERDLEAIGRGVRGQ